MPPTPLRIAQTTSEVKKQHKQSGPRIPERQLKQLERGHELDERAARLREAEIGRKAAKKKREQREEKERNARKQMGVGLATQLIGYSHTQRQLKSGMEAFLGVKRRKEEEQRRRDAELVKKLEEIEKIVEKEPWDDDDDDVIDADDAVLDLTQPGHCSGFDDDLDDDTLLEAHAMIMSDAVVEPTADAHARLPSPPQPVRLAPAAPPPPPPPPSRAASAILPKPAPRSVVAPVLPPPVAPRKDDASTPTFPQPPVPSKDDADFVRLHGPINKAIETILEKQPGLLLELLSQDVSLKPKWDPTPALLHKLNPIGLPPHRLRLKVGSVVTLLRDLNTSSQLSKSQHLRILRHENERLECLVLDGQLEGTTALLTRVPFPAQYRNDASYPFRRTQFPIRIATDYTPSRLPREAPNTGFKLPSVPGHVRASSLPKKLPPAVQSFKPQANKNPTFKLPGLPASIKAPPKISPPIASIPPVSDGWDDFLDSGTQIARELCAELPPTEPVIPLIAETFLPLSTQDLDFSMDDLEEIPASASAVPLAAKPPRALTRTTSLPASAKPPTSLPPHTHNCAPAHPSPLPHPLSADKRSIAPLKPRSRLKQNIPARAPYNLDALTPSQKPPSISDRPGLKRKPFTPSTNTRIPPTKRPCAQNTRAQTTHQSTSGHSIFDFGMSTQEAASFFDDEDFLSGSPPIAV
jgi:hypothetical protein